ncbi:MAG TPA: type II toxin-antitoxin system RelE/ParE family toxin [Rhizomicrobium sp.]|jgi:toxin ParE1/3/4
MIIWAPRALVDIKEAWDFIAVDNEPAADRAAVAINAAGESLAQFPLRGRRGKRPGTRELVVLGTPYYLVYHIRRIDVEIARVIHGAQDWPPGRK